LTAVWSEGAAAAARTNWTAVREEYVTGSESVAQIAARHSLSCRTVENRALERASDVKTWGRQRRDFRESVARRYRLGVAQMVVEAAAGIEDTQRRHVRELVDRTVPVAIAALRNGDVSGLEAVRAALAALQLRREIFGLDRVSARMELSGRDGAAIEHDVELGKPLDDCARAASQRALAAIFGTAA